MTKSDTEKTQYLTALFTYYSTLAYFSLLVCCESQRVPEHVLSHVFLAKSLSSFIWNLHWAHTKDFLCCFIWTVKAVGHFGTVWGRLEQREPAEAVWLAETGCSFSEEVAEVFCVEQWDTLTPHILFVCVCLKFSGTHMHTHPTGCGPSSAQLLLLASGLQSLTSLSLLSHFLKVFSLDYIHRMSLDDHSSMPEHTWNNYWEIQCCLLSQAFCCSEPSILEKQWMQPFME